VTMTMRSMNWWRVAAAAVSAVLLMAACDSTAGSGSGGSASPSSSPAATAAPASGSASARCQAAADLRASVDQLTHVKIGKGTADEIKSDLANVEAKLTALTAQLHDELHAQASAVKSALDALRTALSNLTAQPSTSTAKGVATALDKVAATTRSLLSALAPECGSASASASP
jgi:hypothetical protein